MVRTISQNLFSFVVSKIIMKRETYHAVERTLKSFPMSSWKYASRVTWKPDSKSRNSVHSSATRDFQQRHNPSRERSLKVHFWERPRPTPDTYKYAIVPLSQQTEPVLPKGFSSMGERTHLLLRSHLAFLVLKMCSRLHVKNSGKILSGFSGLGPPYCLSRILARVLPRAQSGIPDLQGERKKTEVSIRAHGERK